MKLKRFSEFLCVTAAGGLILGAAAIVAAAIIAVCITLLVMMAVVTIGTVFALALPYKPITAMVALAALVALSVLLVRRLVFHKDSNPAPQSTARN